MTGGSRSYKRADGLDALYLPQVEQFGVRLTQRDGALLGTCSNDVADGAVWVYPLDGVGVITSHRLAVKRDVPFSEGVLPSLCIGVLSADSMGVVPIGKPADLDAVRNVAVFGQSDMAGKSYWLHGGSVHDAVSIILLPTWFDRFDGRVRQVGRTLVGEPGETCVDEHAGDIARIARCVSPLFGGVRLGERGLHRQVVRAALSAIDWHEQRNRAERAAGCHEQADLVRAAKRLVELHLAEPLSLDALARDLLASRTRLCAAFKQETGESLGGYIRRRRMERACDLLRIRALSVAEVARAVGYERTSSFTVSFERAHGLPPTTWRESTTP